MKELAAQLPDVKKVLGLVPTAYVGAVGIAVLLGGIAFALYTWWQKRKAEKAEDPGPAVQIQGSRPPPGAPQLSPYQLRRAWWRFLRQLPPTYRRSILSFEQFIVLGAASSGKSKVVDTYTDWRRQTKQFVGSESYDPDLQVYLASGAVVMEIPERILQDHTEKCRVALRHLWKPLFRDRAPTVLVTVDAMRLADSTPDVIVDLAETIRGKVNVLGLIRKTPIEVRVVVTHLDALEGYSEFASFCREEGISTRIPLPRRKDEPTSKRRLDAWIDGARGHLPRALTRLPASDYRRVIAFLRRAPDVLPTLAQFLDSLLEHEALSPDPICGGVYLASDPAGLPNPLRGAMETGPGPDPRRNHLMVAAAFAGLTLAYLTIAYSQQYALYRPAAKAAEDYRASTYGSEGERKRRESIAELAYHPRTFVQRFPRFFESGEIKLRKKLSDTIRNELLLPRLQLVAQRGAVDRGLALPTRRSLYYLGLIHDDHEDAMQILEPQRLEIWSTMTELSPEIITDYIQTVDVAYSRPLQFDLSEREVNPYDSADYWVSFLNKLAEVIAAGVVSRDELKALQARATDLADTLDRFDHDDVTASILDRLDESSGLAATKQPGAIRLKAAYGPKYADFLDGIKTSNVLSQRDSFKTILHVVRSASLDVNDTPLLRSLVERLALLYAAPSSSFTALPVARAPEADGGAPPQGDAGRDAEIATAAADAPRDRDPSKETHVRLAGKDFKFDAQRWRDLMRDSEASIQITTFAKPGGRDYNIFFGNDADADLRAVVWNPSNDGSAIFTGKSTIEPRFTQAAYDKRVREVVLRLSDVLAKTNVPADHKRQLNDFVREQVRWYAGDYRRSILRFFQSFGIHAPSQEALRVALTQIAEDKDSSPFNDFVTAVDRNTLLDVDNALLEPIREATADFDKWHSVVNAASGTPEIVNYRAIIKTLAADLGPMGQSSGLLGAGTVPVEPEPQAGADSLEKTLTPAGRIVLSIVRNEKGSYASLVQQWLASTKLPEYQRVPFLAPLAELNVVGRRDVEHVISRAWERDMLPDVRRLAERFPFTREATEEVTPRELSELFEPNSGRFFDLFRRYIEPVSEFADGAPFRERRSVHGNLSLPVDMYTVINACAALSSQLWDTTGKPQPLPLRIETMPFEHGTNPRSANTLVYMNVGDASVFNFNQKPRPKTIHIEWTKEQTSQVGVQLTDLDTKENQFPEPIATDPSFWSFLRLIQKAGVADVKQPANAQLYTWKIKHRKAGNDSTDVRFVLIGNPWAPFTLGKTLRIKAPAKPATVTAVN